VKLAEAVVAQVHRSGGEVSVDGEDSPILGCATGSIKGVSDRLPWETKNRENLKEFSRCSCNHSTTIIHSPSFAWIPPSPRTSVRLSRPYFYKPMIGSIGMGRFTGARFVT
ncbi:hypothetical protein, partial [Thiocystis violacea]|uniref:hypothetical protein n=1 Tax=Thiocystis violacea TaxID=13725 RepID=UPI001F5B02DD